MDVAVVGDVRGGDWICGTVAKELDAVVVSVEYRLAPQYPFPAAVDDAVAFYAALRLGLLLELFDDGHDDPGIALGARLIVAVGWEH